MLLRLQNSIASMTAMTREQERTANNLANANTVGYKRDRTFTETLDEYMDHEGAPRSERASAQWADLQQGSLQNTGNPLDFALDGPGFFVLSDEATGDQRYTRAGRFTMDAEGMLRTPQGLLVEGESGPLQLPPNADDIDVTAAGDVMVEGQVVGRLRVVQFEAPDQLRRLDGATFHALDQEPDEVDNPNILQGRLEASNVDPIKEMTEMITHFRLFESQQKLLQSQDQVLGAITRDLGRF